MASTDYMNASQIWSNVHRTTEHAVNNRVVVLVVDVQFPPISIGHVCGGAILARWSVAYHACPHGRGARSSARSSNGRHHRGCSREEKKRIVRMRVGSRCACDLTCASSSEMMWAPLDRLGLNGLDCFRRADPWEAGSCYRIGRRQTLVDQWGQICCARWILDVRMHEPERALDI
jgi:hypothetical protein